MSRTDGWGNLQKEVDDRARTHISEPRSFVRCRGLPSSRAFKINEVHESDAIHGLVTRLDWIIWEHMGRWNAITREATEETFDGKRKGRNARRQ